jgi:hypothetical protein
MCRIRGRSLRGRALAGGSVRLVDLGDDLCAIRERFGDEVPDGAVLFVYAEDGDFKAGSAGSGGDEGPGWQGRREERAAEGNLPAGGGSGAGFEADVGDFGAEGEAGRCHRYRSNDTRE